MSTPPHEEQPDQNAIRERFSETIQELAWYRHLRTDQALADAMGRKRATVNAYKKGATSANLEWLEAFAAALQVPVNVLLLSAEEAVTWAKTNRPNDVSMRLERRKNPSHQGQRRGGSQVVTHVRSTGEAGDAGAITIERRARHHSPAASLLVAA